MGIVCFQELTAECNSAILSDHSQYGLISQQVVGIGPELLEGLDVEDEALDVVVAEDAEVGGHAGFEAV